MEVLKETEEEKVDMVADSEVTQKYIKDALDDVYSNLLDSTCENAINYVDWLKVKTVMRNNPEIDKPFHLRSRVVYYINLGRNVGAEIEKDRPCIFLSGSSKSETAIVIPISDEDRYIGSTFWYHVPIEGVGTALVEQIRTISKTRIRCPAKKGTRYINISDEEISKVNFALSKLMLHPNKR